MENKSQVTVHWKQDKTKQDIVVNKNDICMSTEGEHQYHFFRDNQETSDIKIYS